MTFAEHAHEYVRKGYSPIPIPAGKKAPPPDGWTGKAAPMASGADVQAWIDMGHGEDNIGLRLPDNLIVIDVDNHKHPAFATMNQARAELGGLPKFGRSASRIEDKVSGHRFFRVPEGLHFVGNLNKIFGEGVDIVQHSYRYVVAPPSLHPDGGQYRWLDADGNEGPLPAVEDFPELPQPWLERLRASVEVTEVVIPPHTTYDHASPETKLSVDRWVKSTLAEIYGELDDMKTWPEGKADEHGGWEEGILHRTMRLASIVMADWNRLGVDDITSTLPEHMPHGGGFTVPNGMSKFARALAKPEYTAVVPMGLEAELLGYDWMGPVTPSANTDGEPPSGEPAAAAQPEQDWPERSWDEAGNIERTLHMAGERLVWHEPTSTWRSFDGRLWTSSEPVSGDLPAMWCARAMRKAAVAEAVNYSDVDKVTSTGKTQEGSSKRAKFADFMGKSSGAAMHSAVATTMRRNRHDLDIVTDEPFDPNPYDLGVANGIVDLRTGELRPYAAHDRITKASPVEYDPAAAAPRFEDFLASSLPDDGVRDYLQRILGYSITDSIVQQAMFIHYGPQTANGKSELMKVLARVLGPHLGAASSKPLLKSKNEKSGQDYHDLRGARMLVLSETAEGSALDEPEVKSITAGDMRGDRELYKGKTGSGFEITGKLHISTNHLPHISADEAIKRRIHLVTWPMSFTGDKGDRLITEKLASEQQGVLAWLVAGAMRWHAQLTSDGDGLSRPAHLEMQMADYVASEDSVGRWLAERTMLAVDGQPWMQGRVLYENYRSWWAGESDAKPMSKVAFGRRLSTVEGVEYRRSNGTIYNLSLVTSVNPAEGFFS